MPRPAHHAPEHQALVVNLPGGAANRLLHADRGRFQGAILGLMWLELLSVPGLKMLGYGLVEQRAFGVARVVELGFGTRWPTRV